MHSGRLLIRRSAGGDLNSGREVHSHVYPEARAMSDVVFVALTTAFFAVAAIYVVICYRVR